MNKLPTKVGPVLSSNKKFVDKLKSVVYSDHLTPSEFEEQNNTWLTDLFNIRHHWIPAYFSNIEMAGLLRTTSRSESSNFFFQHFHESGDTLVEFYSSFESAMDKQRLCYVEDEKRSEQIPLTDTQIPFEKDASKLYTLELYYLVREEIKIACFHTSMPDMTRDNETRFFKCKDDLLQDKIFEVSVRLYNNYVQCSCKFYFRKGYLCRHAFAALHQCSIKQIPAAFVKPHWSKNDVKRHSFLGSSKVTDNCEDEDKLDLVFTGVQSINSALTQTKDNTPGQGEAHRADRNCMQFSYDTHIAREVLESIAGQQTANYQAWTIVFHKDPAAGSFSHYKWSETFETDFMFGSSSIDSINAQFMVAFSPAASKRSLQFSLSEESDRDISCSSTTVSVAFLFCIFLFSVSKNSVAAAAGDILRANQIIRDGSTIVSSGGHFELGFINIGTSTNRYVGILYKMIPEKTTVWIANREAPLNTTSGLLKLTSNGNLVILSGSDSVVWSSNSSTTVDNCVVQLLDSGNLVIRDEDDSDPGNYLWQSFDIPGNTQLPGAKLGWNLETGLERYLSSWKSADDPSPGEYTHHIDRDGFPQYMLRKGSAIVSRGGSWNGVSFSGTAWNPDPIFQYDFFSNDKELYFDYHASVVMRRILNPLGYMQRWVWIEKSQNWELYISYPQDDCDLYRSCGAYSSCNIHSSPECKCLNKFQPKEKKEWDVADWSSGCARKVPLTCVNGKGFVKYPGLKLPDTQRSWFDKNMSLDECKRMCLKNCSCTAYANTDIRGSGSGCLLWFNELIDIRDQKDYGQDLYIRMAASELGTGKGDEDLDLPF
ncbi:hypothetical protein POM88_002293 [Heracleum sosnowskyi]|uniref:Non-specific serine/threonine protein kinase n=1 Tax=Heracleum sosnowskyi TaxID=360622 RepID=A0AAD8JGI7_9APIA|nr:hypothetical protein POM88_002293 [Heracleum sosnowskyi]